MQIQFKPAGQGIYQGFRGRVSAQAARLLPILHDPRDLIVLLRVGLPPLVFLPVAIRLLTLPQIPWIVFPVYLIPLLYFGAGPFTLALHLFSHRPFFSKQHPRPRWLLNTCVMSLIGPLYGHTAHSYFVHHVGMHHPEGNGRQDGSSTLSYQRDSWIGFSAYFLRYLFLGAPELFVYLWRHGKRRFAWRFVAGEATHWTLAAVAFSIHPRAAVLVFVLPVFLLRWVMMAGNWAQHAFVDTRDPLNIYRNSVTIINSPYNRMFFNDGYHAEHHLAPRRHWSELPELFERHQDHYVAESAVVFEGIDYMALWFLLMTKNYGALSRRFYRPGSGVAELLRARVRKAESA